MPYRVDRMLQQLRAAGKLARVVGVGVGDVSTCVDERYGVPSFVWAQHRPAMTAALIMLAVALVVPLAVLVREALGARSIIDWVRRWPEPGL